MPRAPLGDTHNFGRRVAAGASGAIAKPRTLRWEWLLLCAESPLRKLLAVHGETFSFLPDLAFHGVNAREGGEVERIELAPIEPSLEAQRSIARIAGRSLALYAWLGIADLHWENLALGADAHGRIVLAPLDVEMILADFALPTETKLLPDADPEYAELSRHACGLRRILPYLGKPISAADLLAMADAYRSTLELLDRHAKPIAESIASLPDLRETPIRVCLRATADYVRTEPLWPPLLDAEIEQMDRGDIPYFFRLYGRPGIHYYADAALEAHETLPLEGDVPQLDPLLRLSRGMRSPSRRSLREQGLFTIFGAFDHPSLDGTHREGELEVSFRARKIVAVLPGGEELETRRDLRAFVGSAYLPCTCGEVRTVLVPPVTVCEVQPPARRGSSRRAREL
jgi:hypothetical protein